MIAKVPGPGDSRSVRGGLIPGTPGLPAFSMTMADAAPLPVMIAVPHAGRVYPADFADRMRHPATAGLRLEDRLVDLLAQAVARETGAALIIAHAPRAMIDLNRAPDDVDWEMISGASRPVFPQLSVGRRARSGLGLVPRRLPGMGEIWKKSLPAADLEERLFHVHQPYHLALSDGLEKLRDRWGSALLIDLHSMPPLGPKHGIEPAADFVVGDRFGAACSHALAAVALHQLSGARHMAAHNRPYAGGYVLDRHGAPARGVHAIQVEVCRTTYLDDHLREVGPGLSGVVQVLTGMVRRLAEELTTGRQLPQAAE